VDAVDRRYEITNRFLWSIIDLLYHLQAYGALSMITQDSSTDGLADGIQRKNAWNLSSWSSNRGRYGLTEGQQNMAAMAIIYLE
jgi:hypothetical protein